MKNIVFNNTIGSPYEFGFPKVNAEVERQLVANLFEQLLIFDTVVITTNRVNYALYFLLKNLGINVVERLFDRGYLKMMIWAPAIITGRGTSLEDGTINTSTIYGQPPIVAGALTDGDLDPERNIHEALRNFNFHRDRKRIFNRRARGHYLGTGGLELSKDAVDIVIDAYENDILAELGLPYLKKPALLGIQEREVLQNLGHKVLETTILSKNNFKSYENYQHYSICDQNLKNIGKAYNIADNTSAILALENLPNLKDLFLNERIGFEDVFKIRYLNSAKYYRKWINTVGENANAMDISKEYLNEIKGKSNFFQTNEGKLLKHLTLFGMGAALGNVIGGTAAVIAELGLGVFDSLMLDNLIKGRSPAIFIENLKKELKEETL
ncbi:hypothetical protein [Albibacterium indicum]|uniref:hypothetical protein n=1 Tax=Albibacterium indicum TaxID=2292082 RepID=UPI000E48B185|nr:hypothetical protein [Pedobacter indicus]